MIESLQGILAFATPSFATVSVNGLGYKVFITPRDFAMLPAISTEITFYTSFVVRDTSHSLYGFLTREERDLFEMLISVSGIGPKTAVALISNINISGLHEAIQTKNASILAKVPGIGKKTAERLLIEMRDKLSHTTILSSTYLKEPQTSKLIHDAMSAMINLGYNQNIAEKAIKKVLDSSNDQLDLPTLITTTLQYM